MGTQTVITWLGEIGDITRFGSVNKLLAYAGWIRRIRSRPGR